MTIRIVAAMDADRAIGCQGEMPWHLPGELRHFYRWTQGTACIMGRTTFESVGCLPIRKNIVLSRDDGFRCDADVVSYSLQGALRAAEHYDTVSIIGGGEVFRQALPLADEVLLTRVYVQTMCGDVFFPEIDKRIWGLGNRVNRGTDAGLYWESRLYRRK